MKFTMVVKIEYSNDRKRDGTQSLSEHFWRKEMSLASAGNRTPDHRVPSPVTVPSTVTRFITTSDSYGNVVQASKCNHFSELNPFISLLVNRAFTCHCGGWAVGSGAGP